jgi:two-component system response regulator CpxR
VVQAAGFALDSRLREVRYGATPLDLTSFEFDLLELLMRSAGRVVSRDELAAILHHRQSLPWERSLDVHISHLRKKLESAGKAPIRTVRGVGYYFAP